MLQNIRDKTSGWTLRIIISVIILTFALWGVQRLFVSGQGTAAVAKVDHTKITSQEFANAYQLARRHAQMQLGAKFFSAPHLSDKIKQGTLKNLVNTAVLQNKLHQLGFIAGPALIESNLIGMPVFQEDGKFSQQRFTQAMVNMGYTTQQFMAKLGQQIMLDQLQAGVIGSDFFLDGEASETQTHLNQLREFNYTIIPASEFAKSVTLSPQALQGYYQEHLADFKTPEQVSASYIQISLQGLMKDVHSTPAAVKQFYQENLARFHHKPYSSIQSEVRQAYIQQEAQKLLAVKTSQLTNLSYEHPNALAPLAAALKEPIKTTPLFSRAGEKVGILANHDFLAAAFSENVLKQGNNSGVINLSNNTVAILHLNQHQAAAVRPFAQVKTQIAQALSAKQAQEMAANIGQQVVSAIQAGRPTAPMMAAHGLIWQHSGFVARQDKKLNSAVLAQAFLLPLNKQAAAGFNLGGKDYVVVNLQAWKAGPSKLTAAQKKTYQQVMAHAYGNTAYQLYEKQLLDQADIKYYTKNMPAI